MKRGVVCRDDWGVPHLWGDDPDELAYAQGYVAVVDRGWQIQVEKWRSEGRLAQRLGASEVPWDRFARRCRLDDTARRCYQRLDERTQGWLRSYVDGVNDALPHADAPEFAATGCAPDPWQPWSPLGVFLVQHVLFGTFPNKLWRAHVAAALGDGTADLFLLEGPGGERAAPDGSGSNAWAIAGDPAHGRAATIAGDPHRILELPGIYQQVRLACPEFDVIGLAFPGVPGVPHFGHAGPVAWAITNAMADYQDLYREQLRRIDDRVEVREADGWTPAHRHVEQIAVRDGAPVTVEVIETARGPVIDVDRATGEAISLRTPTRVEGRLGFEALLPLLRAERVDDVADALRAWVEPVNSVLVADRTGAVVSLVAGLVPIRDDRCRREPVPAWDPRHRWRDGYAPLPRRAVSDTVVNANDRRAGDVAELGTDFAPPHRAHRIRQLLDRGTPAPVIHTDTLVPTATLRDLLARLDDSALTEAAVPALTEAAGRLRARLVGWDGRMDADSADAGAYAAFRGTLVRRLADHPRLRPLCAPSGFDELFAPWTDPVARIGLALDGVVAGLRRLGDDLAPVAVAALEEVAAGPTPGGWGQRHTLYPIRPPVGAADDPAGEAAADACRAVALSGDTDAVLATSSVAGVSDACWRGPVARYVWDLGDRARSRWVVPFGASGRPGDPHFADQLPRWAAGDLIPVPAGPARPAPPPAGPTRPATTARGNDNKMVYEETLPGFGRVTLTVLDPGREAELVHGWVTQRRAAYWGMLGHSVDDVREIYEFVDSLSTHHAYLVRLDDRPIGLFQTYEPAADPVGERYPVQPGDFGMHLLLAPGPRPPRGLTEVVGASLLRFIFGDAAVQRLVVEPDVRNHLALRRMQMSGFTFDNEIDMPDKRAQLAFLTREVFAQRYAAHAE